MLQKPILPTTHLAHELDNHTVRIGTIEDRLDMIQSTVDMHTTILAEHTQTLDQHTRILDDHTRILNEHSQVLAEHTKILADHTLDLQIIKQTLVEHTIRFNVLEDKMDAGFAELRAMIARLIPHHI